MQGRGRGGVGNFFVDKIIQTPPLPLPLKGGERLALEESTMKKELLEKMELSG